MTTSFAQAQRLHQSGQLAKAETLYLALLAREPNNAQLCHLLGVLYHQKGQQEDALALIDQAIAIQPSCHTFFNNQGLVRQATGDIEGAVRSFCAALELNPKFAEAHFNLGCLYHQQQALDQAERCYQNACHYKPDYAKALNNLGELQVKQHQYELAKDTLKGAIALQPNMPEALISLSNVYFQLEDFNNAQHTLEQVLKIKPDHPVALSNYANVLSASGAYEKAIAICQKALLIHPNHVTAWLNLGAVLARAYRPHEALYAFCRANKLSPKSANILYQIGLTHMDLGELTKAIDAFESAILLDPQHAEAHWNLAHVRLKQGHFEKGWSLYHWYWQLPKSHPDRREFPLASWKGSKQVDSAILIWGEQGIGDEIMFASLLPDLNRDVDHIVVECDKRLVPIYQRSFPGLQTIPRQNDPPSFNQYERCHYQLNMGGLAQYYRTRTEDFPRHSGYLTPDAKQVALFKSVTAHPSSTLNVGISWKSGNTRTGSMRTVPLDAWYPILSIEGVNPICIQYGDCAAELDPFKSRLGIDILPCPVDPLVNMDDFFALVAGLDLVISVDNTSVHVAGAVGTPVWCLLPFNADWRWMVNTDTSPWYPSAKLFRQDTPGDWESVLKVVARQLTQLVLHNDQ